MIDRGHGIPVVLIPGIQGRWEWMSPTLDALAQRCRVITFSLCDEPTSDFRFDPTLGFDNYVAQIDEALTRAGLEEAILIGVSYGGLMAAEFAARHPHRVRGLVLVSALPMTWKRDARAGFYMRAPRLLTPFFLLGSRRRMAPELKRAFPEFGKRLRFSVQSGVRVLRALLSPTRMARRVRWVENYQFTDPRQTAVRALVITGEDALDRIVPPALTRRYLEDLPLARATVFADTGHLGFLTKPHEFAETIARFADETWNDARRVSA